MNQSVGPTRAGAALLLALVMLGVASAVGGGGLHPDRSAAQADSPGEPQSYSHISYSYIDDADYLPVDWEPPSPPSMPTTSRPPLGEYAPMEVAAIEPLLPADPSNLPAQWAEFHRLVVHEARSFDGRISVVAIDLTTEARYDFRSRDPYLPASTFKLPVVLCTLEAIQQERLTWDTLVTYTEADWEPVGAGGFATAAFGGRYPVRNLVDRAITASNNVAVKMLARTLTYEGLWECTRALGGPVTRTEDGSTPVSAADEAAWWLHLWRLHQREPALAEELLRPLRQVTYWGRIQAGTPAPELVTHKFGTYAGYDHDGAIIWGERPYLLVVMTYGPSQTQADGAIERIATAAWRAIQQRDQKPG